MIIRSFLMISCVVCVSFVTTLSAKDCAELAKVQLEGVSITEATSIPATAAGAARPGAQPVPALAAHCLVRGVIDRRIGFEGKEYGIGFELRLPESWNGRFLFQGGGGTDGVVRPAIGAGNTTPEPALTRGFAVVSTDAGHQGQDASFGRDQQARLDYAYNALGRVTGIAKQLVSQFYGKSPDRSYFMGCSNGGRQGMMAAQRFPTLFDGIIAGDPGYRLSKAAVAEAWDNTTLLGIAPKDDSGKAIFSQALTDSDLTVFSKAILESCDANDGLKDGLIDNRSACRFDPSIVACKNGQTDACVAPSKVDAMKRIFSGPSNSRGDKLYSDWPWDAGIAAPGWRAWKLGTSKTPQPNAINMTLGAGSIKGYFATPYDPDFDPMKFDFDKDPSRMRQTAAINDPDGTQLSTFSQRGGKLLLYHGMSDPVFSANDTISYYQSMAADNGGMETTKQWSRLYLIPGMNHCGGGPALDQFDALTALVDWVEKGAAPARIRATGQAFSGRSRPLCAFPAEARYKGTGSIEDAENFECR